MLYSSRDPELLGLNRKESTVNLAALGAVAGDAKRAAIVVHLLGAKAAEDGAKLKAAVEAVLGRRISYGSFGWHIAQLRASSIIEMDERKRYRLTSTGVEVAEFVREPLMASIGGK